MPMFLLRRVEGLSMTPSYPPGKIVFGWRFRKPQVGDVVIARYKQIELIKRISHQHEDKVYLLGDNPVASTDSRQYGWLPASSILAVVSGGRAHG